MMSGSGHVIRICVVRHAAVTAVLMALLLAAGRADVCAQSIAGRVIDAGTGTALGGATLRLIDARKNALYVTVADDSGRFVLRAGAAGSYTVEAQNIGYATTQAGPVRLETDAETVVELRLSSMAVALEPIRVLVQPRNARLDRVDYYHRQRFHNGVFIDRGEIERRNPFDMASLLRGRPGVRVGYSPVNGSLQVVLRGGIGTSLSSNVCPPRVFMNGAPLHEFDFRDISPDQLEGIEIYPGASSIPAQFGGSTSSCGVVLLWIRSG
jgi:hypothetical protein